MIRRSLQPQLVAIEREPMRAIDCVENRVREFAPRQRSSLSRYYEAMVRCNNRCQFRVAVDVFCMPRRRVGRVLLIRIWYLIRANTWQLNP